MKKFKDTTMKAIVTIRGISPLLMGKSQFKDIHWDFPFVSPYETHWCGTCEQERQKNKNKIM